MYLLVFVIACGGRRREHSQGSMEAIAMAFSFRALNLLQISSHHSPISRSCFCQIAAVSAFDAAFKWLAIYLSGFFFI